MQNQWTANGGIIVPEVDSDDDDPETINKENNKDFSLWWANKELLQTTPETLLSTYIGNNEKTKVVIKIALVSDHSYSYSLIDRCDDPNRNYH